MLILLVVEWSGVDDASDHITLGAGLSLYISTIIDCVAVSVSVEEFSPLSFFRSFVLSLFRSFVLSLVPSCSLALPLMSRRFNVNGTFHCRVVPRTLE